MTSHFNLIDEKWIPCAKGGATVAQPLSLREVLVDTHTLQMICGAVPTETAALYRLLLAVLYAAHYSSEQDHDDLWKRLWKDGHFNSETLEAYFQRVHERFFLFDERYPFYQDVTLQRDYESVSSLMPHIASGADATLFDHHSEQGGFALTYAEAARALVTIQTFGLSGTKGPASDPNYPPFPNAPCARGVVFLLEGDNLFQTLMLNLFDPRLSSHFFRRGVFDGDRPAWESDNPMEGNPDRPFGYLDYLTWPNRRVRLKLAPDGLVREMMYAPGLKTADPKNHSVRDTFNPMFHWRANLKPTKAASDNAEPRSHAQVIFKRDEALWRDSTTLLRFYEPEGKHDLPPAALVWARAQVKDKMLEWAQTYRYLALGMCSDLRQDKIFFYRMDILPLPLGYLENPKLVKQLEDGLTAAKNAGTAVVMATKRLAEFVLSPDHDRKSGRKPDKKAVANLAASWGAERYFWSGLEAHFHRLMKHLPNERQPVFGEWARQLRWAANAAFDQAEQCAAFDLRSQRAVAVARSYFDAALNRALSPLTARKGDDDESSNG